LREFPVAWNAADLVATLRPLTPRLYSIASSPKVVGPDEVHLTVAVVEYVAHGSAHCGAASSFLAGAGDDATVPVFIEPNERFRLPADGSRDVIMIGPGTGVAPFRAFVQERRAIGASGKSWLFFGDRQYTHDFLYQLEWQDALKDGSLTRIDLAFSRDTPSKVYVQHRLWEQRHDLVEWLENGAQLYVCGDAKAMAKDVRAAIVAAYTDVKALSAEAAELAVAELERGRRYHQDVY